MTDLQRSRADYLQELKQVYSKLGYEVLSPRQVREQLGFEPDLLVRKDDKITVVEVKMGSRASSQPIREMRRKAETFGYGFELKVVPRVPRDIPYKNDIERIPDLLALAKHHLESNECGLALLLSWIAIETAVRAQYEHIDKDAAGAVAPSDILRMSFELGLNDEVDAADLRTIAELRNRYVHGFEADVDRSVAKRALKYATTIAKMARSAPAPL